MEGPWCLLFANIAFLGLLRAYHFFQRLSFSQVSVSYLLILDLGLALNYYMGAIYIQSSNVCSARIRRSLPGILEC